MPSCTLCPMTFVAALQTGIHRRQPCSLHIAGCGMCAVPVDGLHKDDVTHEQLVKIQGLLKRRIPTGITFRLHTIFCPTTLWVQWAAHIYTAALPTMTLAAIPTGSISRLPTVSFLHAHLYSLLHHPHGYNVLSKPALLHSAYTDTAAISCGNSRSSQAAVPALSVASIHCHCCFATSMSFRAHKCSRTHA